MFKYTFLLTAIISINASAQDSYDAYLLFSIGGLNGVHSSDKAVELERSYNLNNYEKIQSQKFKYKNVIIDLSSSVNYKVQTPKAIFKYDSDADFGGRMLDRLSNRTIVFGVQPIGDYLLFREDTKVTCFNLKQEKPCSKFIPIEQNSQYYGINQRELFFYRNRNENLIFQCKTGVGFEPDKDAARCYGEQYTDLDKLM
jgi:hypothetical protein